MKNFVQTGCISLDKLLGKGFLTKCVSLVYGEAETGKTSLAVQCAVNCAKRGIKSLYFDVDGTFSYERLLQISEFKYEQISPLIIIFRPKTFQDQSEAIDQLEKVITKKFGLIVIDTITSLYRVELDDIKKTYIANRELNRQLAALTQIAITCELAVLVNSQVRSVPFESDFKTKPVATRVLNYWSDLIINMKKTGKTGVINVIREKHPKIKGIKNIYVKIDSSGIIDYKY